MALGLAGASRAEADAFLRDQRKLVGLQAKELAHELELRHWSLWVRHVSGVLKLALELSAGLLLLAAIAGISLMVWNAAHADGLVIESFSVPPDLAARGLTGQAIAGQLTDRLSQLANRNQFQSRRTRSYANDWGSDIKVEISTPGFSIRRGLSLPEIPGWDMRPMSAAMSGARPPALPSPPGSAAAAATSPAPRRIWTA